MPTTTVEPPGPRGDTSAPLPWHAEPADRVLARLESSTDGLSTEEAADRLRSIGPNTIERRGGPRAWTVLWRQIDEPLIWVLIGAAALALLLGKVDDGIVVAAVVVLNTIVGFVQEYRAGKAIEALAAMVPEETTVVRDGRASRVPVATLVPGDVVRLAAGDKGPADVRLLAASNLAVDEATLTGESVPVRKATDPVGADDPLGDRTSMVFGGTLAATGSATAVVVATGADTELGKVSAMLDDVVELETPLTRALGRVGRVISIGVLVLAVGMLALGTFRAVDRGASVAEGLADSAIFAISLAVGAIPEGLPAIVTVALAIGVRRMANRRAIVRSLPAIETLGSTTVICSDKTGTLTRNEMAVRRIVTHDAELAVDGVGYEPDGAFRAPDERDRVAEVPNTTLNLLRDAMLASDATLERRDERWTINGDPTEGAIVVAGAKAGLDAAALERRWPRIAEVPFDADLQLMAALVDGDDGRRIVVKGSPEAILARSSRWSDGTEVDRDAVLADVERLAAEGLRVLAVGTRKADRGSLAVADLDGLGFGGLVAMMDPPRTEAIAAVQACHDAGITVKMITGDHGATATAIGRQLGLSGTAVTGPELAAMDDAELDRVVTTTDVFARVAPEHKLRLVRALQRRSEVVAMTGDGTNDAPALAQADIGVAMGITGTSVTKETADVVLTDDNFATIEAAVEEGRRVFDNLVKSLAFILPTNLGLALILLFAVAFFPFDAVTGELLLPIQPTQILWINLVASVALAVPLAFEVAEPDAMRRAPRTPGASPLSRFVVARTALVATLMAAGAVAVSWWEYRTQLDAGVGHEVAIADAQTMAVTTVIAFQVFYLLQSRTLRGSVRVGFFSNPAVLLGIAAITVLQLGFVYAPFMQAVFDTAPISLRQMAFAVLVGASVVPMVAVEKRFRARGAAIRPDASVP
ncbi:MAG TPA: HAD-IC family P-type ATPase [Actinomycetota bacterium]|nr:HAD-IC family P-type ATPase [Actinomycetota bacterium]